MAQYSPLLETLERLFAGPRESALTLNAFLAGLEVRSYAFIIAALDLPNCIPTGIPLLSTLTGIPMLVFALQGFLGQPTPSLPDFLGNRALPRGKLQDLIGRIRRPVVWLQNAVHARRRAWVTGRARRLLQVAWGAMILVLALPIPFDNLLPAWSILFFCLALLERDGVMALLGWLLALLTVVWTIFLLVVGPLVVMGLLRFIL